MILKAIEVSALCRLKTNRNVRKMLESFYPLFYAAKGLVIIEGNYKQFSYEVVCSLFGKLSLFNNIKQKVSSIPSCCRTVGHNDPRII